MTLLAQLPRLSPYDPGVTGEGSLDPLGLGAIADRIADQLVPALRARMGIPGFATLTAVGAVATQPLAEIVGADGSTTADLAFEWLVVSALVGAKDSEAVRSLPGSQKARQALNSGDRLNAQTYLRGPRVFGFTGVYRPFSVDSGIIDRARLPSTAAEALIAAWERDSGMTGFFGGPKSSAGGKFRANLEEAAKQALANNEAPKSSGAIYPDIRSHLVPSAPGASARQALHRIITHSKHPERDELARLLIDNPPPAGAEEHEIAAHLRSHSQGRLRAILDAAIAYEECTTLIDRAFRQLLRHLTAQSGFAEPTAALPFLAEAANQLPGLTMAAIEAAADLDSHASRSTLTSTALSATSLAAEVELSTELFRHRLTPAAMFDALIERHRQVQESKGKRMWLDEVKGGWFTRPMYVNQPLAEDAAIWTHPMRLHTLRRFVETTL